MDNYVSMRVIKMNKNAFTYFHNVYKGVIFYELIFKFI